MFKMVTMFMIVSFFTAYGNNVVLNESNIQISKTSKKDVKKVEYQKQNLYGADRTVKRQLSSNLKVKKKLNNKVNLKDGKGQVSAAQLNQSAKPKEGAIIKERYVSNKKLNVGPRKSISESQISRNTRDHETLFFSEYAEPNGGNHKYLEIYNGTGADVDLYDYLILGNNNGKVISDTLRFPMGTIVSDGDVYVVAHASSSTDIIAEADTLITNPYDNDPDVSGEPDNFICSFNGDDVRVLAHITSTGDTVVVDQLGILDYDGDGFAGDESLLDADPNHGGDDPGSGFPVAGDSNGMKDQTLVRKPSVSSGNGGNWSLSAGTDAENSEWILENPPTNTYSPTTVGSHEIEQEDGPYLS